MEGPDPLALVQAIGIKVRNHVLVGGEEIEREFGLKRVAAAKGGPRAPRKA